MTRAVLALLAAFFAASPPPCAADEGPKPERVLSLFPTEVLGALAVSPDGTRLAALDGKKLWLLSLPEGNVLASADAGLALFNTTFLFSPDGSKLAFSSELDYLKIFDGRTGKPLKTGLPQDVSLVKDVDAGFTLASSYSDGVYELATGTKVLDLKGKSQRIALSNDGRLAASESGGDDVVWQLPEGRELWRHPDSASGAVAFVFSPDGKTLAKLSGNSVVILDASTGSEIGSTTRVSQYDRPVYSPDSSVFALKQGVGIELFSPSAAPLRTLENKDGLNPGAAAFSRDSQSVYAAVGYGSIQRYNVSDGSVAGGVGAVGDIVAMAVSPDGKTLAAAYMNSGIVLIDLASGKLKRRLPSQPNVFRLAFSPDGRRLAAGGPAGSALKVYDQDGAVVYTLASDAIESLEFTPDGKRLLVGSGYETQLWNMDTGELVTKLSDHGALSALTPDGKRVVSAIMDSVVLWNPLTGAIVRDFEGLKVAGENRSAQALALSPDGKLLAAGDDHGAVALWELGSAKLLRTLKAQDKAIKSLRFTDGGRKLLVTQGESYDPVRPTLFDAASGEKLPLPEIGKTGCATLIPSERVLLACDGREVLAWRLAPEPAKTMSAKRKNRL